MTWAEDYIYIPSAVIGFTHASILDYLVEVEIITYTESLRYELDR